MENQKNWRCRLKNNNYKIKIFKKISLVRENIFPFKTAAVYKQNNILNKKRKWLMNLFLQEH